MFFPIKTWFKKKRHQLEESRYGLRGDSKDEDMRERVETRRRLIDVQEKEKENSIRITRLEGATRILTTRVRKLESKEQ